CAGSRASEMSGTRIRGGRLTRAAPYGYLAHQHLAAPAIGPGSAPVRAPDPWPVRLVSAPATHAAENRPAAPPPPGCAAPPALLPLAPATPARLVVIRLSVHVPWVGEILQNLGAGTCITTSPYRGAVCLASTITLFCLAAFG